MRTLALAAGLAVACLSAPLCAEPAPVYKVGVTTRDYLPEEPYDWRGSTHHVLTTTIWYPATPAAREEAQWVGRPDSPLFSVGTAARDAEPAAGRQFPVIMLSHGYGGSAASIGWLAAALAGRGYVVAGVDHPGNNSRDRTPQGSMLWWERAADISAVLSQVLADPAWAGRLDTARIGGAGFSMGGYTMVALAGGITKLEQLDKACRDRPESPLCRRPPETPGDFPSRAELRLRDPAFAAANAKAGDSYRDPRIRAVFLMAPGLGVIFTPESLRAITLPVAVTVGDDDQDATVESSRAIVEGIPGARINLLQGGVGHYVFMGECTEAGRQTLPAICRDAAGVDRAAIHQRTIDMAADFFAATLK